MLGFATENQSRTSELLRHDHKYIWHPYSVYPLVDQKVITRAQGCFVYDAQGHQVLDATSSWWCNTVGHSHPRLVRALYDAASTLDHVLFAPHTHPVAIDFADALSQKLRGVPRLFFSDNGSTAVEVALKLLLQYWQIQGKSRPSLACFEEAYHGDTFGAMAVSAVTPWTKPFQNHLFPSVRLPLPTISMCTECGCPCEQHAWEKLESILSQKASSIAGALLEPRILGAAGMKMYGQRILERLVGTLRKYDIPVVFDEVFTGFGRTGSWFCQNSLEQGADIVCLSKGITGGLLPMGVTAVAPFLFEPFAEGDGKTALWHGHTFTGNAITMAVAREHLRIMEEENILDAIAKLEQIYANVHSRFEKWAFVKNTRFCGGVWACDIPQWTPDQKRTLVSELWNEGIWVRPLHNTLYFMPPYTVPRERVETFFDKLDHLFQRAVGVP